MVITFLSIVAVPVLIIFFYIRQDKFGKAPSGERLALLKQSPHYRDGKFNNMSPTPQLAEGYSIAGVIYTQIFKKAPRRRPAGSIPHIRTNLLKLNPDEDVLVWFGHSSYFMQADGKRILVDPVFSGSASPVPGTNKSFKGTDNYSVEDLPPIDYLFITHDHYDHADYETLTQLKTKTDKVICGLGVGAHLEHWGYEKSVIVEKDWGDRISFGDGFVVYVTPARHFSGRSFSRNNTLWCSYVLQTPTLKIFIGGDSGYDTHFADIGREYGPFDLAVMDNGQYNAAWQLIHAMPHEVLQATLDLKAERLFPAHSSKFAMANHPWDEPLRKITELNEQYNIPLVTPMIGEVVRLKDSTQPFKQWWVNVQ